MKTTTKALLVAMLVLTAMSLVAAQTTYEVKSGTVVSTFGDKLVVRLTNGEEKEITVPAGYKFNVDGKQLGLSELTPGTQLTATIKTTHTPETVKTVTVRDGEVLKVTGNTLWFREGGVNKAAKIPSGFKFDVNGEKVPITDLRPGMKLTAEVVTTSERTVTDRDVQMAGSTPPPPPAPAAPAPAMAAAPEPAPAAAPVELPKTASPLPLIGVLGLALMAAGATLRRARS
jgi:RNase P/RNase MRP subunit p29